VCVCVCVWCVCVCVWRERERDWDKTHDNLWQFMPLLIVRLEHTVIVYPTMLCHVLNVGTQDHQCLQPLLPLCWSTMVRWVCVFTKTMHSTARYPWCQPMLHAMTVTAGEKTKKKKKLLYTVSIFSYLMNLFTHLYHHSYCTAKSPKSWGQSVLGLSSIL